MTQLLESPNAKTLLTTSIVDSAGLIWGLIASTLHGVQVTINGVLDASTAHVHLLLYWNHRVYHQNASGQWFVHSQTGWAAAADPRVTPTPTPAPVPTPTPTVATESPSGTKVTSTGSIVDSHGAVWTLVPTTTAGQQIAVNGKIDVTTANVSLLLYFRHVVYQQNSAGGWWLWNAGWQDTTDPRGVPSPTPAPIPTPVPTPAPTPTPSGGTGPAANGSFVNVDFAAPTGRIAPAALWGVAVGAPNDSGFALCNDPGYLNAAAQIMPSLYRINSATGLTGYWSDQIFANGVGNPDWSVIAPFINNGYRFISSTCRLIIGVRFNAMNVTDYANACATLARYFKTTLGGNGKPLKVWGWEIGNEDDGTDINTYCNYFNAAADALHAIDPSYKIIGTVDSYANPGRLTSFAQQCGSRIGAICYHSYAYCSGSDPVPSDFALVTSGRPASDAQAARAAVAGTAAADVPIFMGEWNMECSASGEPRQQQPIAAVFAATWMLNAFFSGSGVDSGAMWEIANDGTYGMIQNGSIDPAGYFMGKAGAVMGGQETSSNVVGANNCTVLAVKNGSKIGVMVVNFDANNALNGPVALSHWPINTSGSGTIHKWEISNANPSGSLTTINVNAGITDTIDVPAMSVVILY